MREFLGSDLTRREAQIMEILHRRGRATAAEIQKELPDPPGYSAVRKLLEVLRDKGQVQFEYDGPRHVYFPSIPPEEARRSAIDQVVKTFFDDDPGSVVAALLEGSEIDREELDRIIDLVEKAKREGR